MCKGLQSNPKNKKSDQCLLVVPITSERLVSKQEVKWEENSPKIIPSSKRLNGKKIPQKLFLQQN